MRLRFAFGHFCIELRLMCRNVFFKEFPITQERDQLLRVLGDTADLLSRKGLSGGSP